MTTTFQVSSVTYAMKGKNLLERNGIRAYITRTIDQDGQNGCGYNVVVNMQAEKAEHLLRSTGIHIRGIQRDGYL